MPVEVKMKNLYKRVIVLMIVVAMVFTMVACRPTSSGYTGINEDSKEAVKYDSSKLRGGYPAEIHNTEEYNSIEENAYKSVLDHPISTFSADVDTASYSNIRRFINDGQVIDTGAVRIEEMINYFKYDYPNPKDGEPFSVTTELSDCPWNEDSKLILIGLKTEDIDFSKSPDSNLVFLLDVSGSMDEYNKLPLMIKSFKMLTANLTEKDKVSIVTYASDDRIVIEGVSGNNAEIINEALDGLMARGSTHGSKGIITAYELAEKYFIKGGNNRVILATDGDLNVGLTSESELEKLITEKKNSGVFLSVLGFGTGNIKDNKMEILADKGNGNYSYIDSLYEAKKVLVDEMGATLVTVAKDVKLQVEFNPANVKGYRLIGYENRLLATEDFNDDKKDAGEIGAGHSVTALYEVVLKDSKMEIPSTELKYQSGNNTNNTDELLTVNIRYKKPDRDVSELMSKVVKNGDYKEALPNNLKFASAVAEFGMILRESKYIGDTNYNNVLDLLDDEIVAEDKYRIELVELVKKAAEIYDFKIDIENGLKEVSTNIEKNLTEEEVILKEFSKAEVIYAWFTNDASIATNNVMYGEHYQVDFENMKSKSDLKIYLSNYFDDKTIEELLNAKVKLGGQEYEVFVEHEGKLYYYDNPPQVGYSGVYKEFSKITKDNENKFTITVDMIWKGILGGGPYLYASYDYTYEKIDDKWIFTNFKLPYRYCLENGVEKPENLVTDKSPDGKYRFEFNRVNGFFGIYKDNVEIMVYSTESDMEMPWDDDIMELQDYWWDLDFNKLYLTIGPNIYPSTKIFCVNLISKDVELYDTVVQYNPENINKKTNYIYFTDKWKSLDADSSSQEYYTRKKYGNYILNLRTNEKIYMNSTDGYSLNKLNDTSITYNKYLDGEKLGEFSIDISLYVDKNRGKYVNQIRNAIIKAHNNTLKNDNIELCQIFSSKETNYQIVKINIANKISYHELWKIGDDKYERMFTRMDNIFLTDNHKYLCIANKSGEFKVYDDSFSCIIDENIYSERILSKYKTGTLDIGNYYFMNDDKYIFLTVKSEDMLVDVVNVDLETKSFSGIPYEIEFPYINHFINSRNGYMIYQTGPSIISYNENVKKEVFDYYGAQRSLIAINLLNNQKREIDNDNCSFLFYIESQGDSLTYSKYIQNVSSSDTVKTFYFDKEFIGK